MLQIAFASLSMVVTTHSCYWMITTMIIMCCITHGLQDRVLIYLPGCMPKNQRSLMSWIVDSYLSWMKSHPQMILIFRMMKSLRITPMILTFVTRMIPTVLHQAICFLGSLGPSLRTCKVHVIRVAAGTMQISEIPIASQAQTYLLALRGLFGLVILT